MKKYFLMMLAVLGTAFTSQAQQAKNKSAKADVEVSGNCDLCKKRIEKAALGVKGVKMATWNADEQKLHLILDENKTNVKNVEQAVAKAGHDTQDVKATNEAYENLHACCQYDREA